MVELVVVDLNLAAENKKMKSESRSQRLSNEIRA